MRRLFGLVVFLGASSCSGSRASLELEDARASWVNLAINRHIYVDIDVLAHDQLGNNIGSYCAELVVPFQKTITICDDDLSDGDRKTVRLESERDVNDLQPITVGIRHAGGGAGRDLIGPATPR